MDPILAVCGVISLLGLWAAARENPRGVLISCAFVAAGFGLAAAMPTPASRLAPIVVGMAGAVVARRRYDARRPNRSRTRR
jgi:hypothetical protein